MEETERRENCPENIDDKVIETETCESPPKKKKRKYFQRYLIEWENLAPFRGWLTKSSKGEGYGYCRLCDRDLMAGKSELLRHAKGKKHQDRCLKIHNQSYEVQVENEGNEIGGELNLVCYIDEQNIPYTVTDHLQQSICTVSSIVKGHRTLFQAKSAMEERSAKINSAKGLIAAPFTPFRSDGNVNLELIPHYVEFLTKNNVRGVFVNGTTGEGVSLTVSERKQIAEKWVAVGKDVFDVIIIQIGTSNIRDSQELARHAEKIGATAIASLPPLYYKPQTEDELIQYLKEIASSAPLLPFLYYHIPSFNGVEVSISKLLHDGKQQIPTFCGAKYTSGDCKELMKTLQLGKFKILSGFDDILLTGLPMGVTAAVGATYNFMPLPSNRILESFAAGDETIAWEEQMYVRQVLDIISKYGSMMAALKTVMNLFGPFNVGEPRLPLLSLTTQQINKLKAELEQVGVERWYK
ncbi:N-acetylneuraminate lyase isoform X2 [Centruroides vittatus]|uniref:N-acetylneuraminate lyase isoform X2 n=1 Tax=Centruroides vittatus TaxID=120091 RepID=UPI0035109C87